MLFQSERPRSADAATAYFLGRRGLRARGEGGAGVGGGGDVDEDDAGGGAVGECEGETDGSTSSTLVLSRALTLSRL